MHFINDLENAFLIDNAPHHRAEQTQLEIGKVERLEHAPYSTSQVLLPEVEGETPWQPARCLNFNRSLGDHWYHDVFSKWVTRHEKFIELDGEYFAKR